MQKLFAVLVVGLLSIPLLAQDTPKAEVFGGYQYLHIGSNSDLSTDGQGFNGWNAAAQYNFTRNLGFEGDFSGSYATISGVSTHIYTYTGGPVVFAEAGRIKPFAHVLFGGAKLSGTNSGVTVTFNGYTVIAGGGVDAKFSRSLAWRVAQVDWLYYHFNSKNVGGVAIPTLTGSKNVRISTGIVLRF